MSSGCLWRSADCPEWKGGSNQNQRSDGKSAFISTSAMRKRSSKASPAKSRPQRRADGRAGAVAGEKIVGLERIGPVRRLERGTDAVRPAIQRDQPVLPSQIDEIREIGAALDQILLDVVLLEIDEGRHLVAGLGQEVEGVDLLVAVEEASDLPGDALIDHPLADAEAVEYFQGALRPANRPAADRDDVVVVDDHRWNAMERQIDGSGQSDRPCTDDQDRRGRPAPPRSSGGLGREKVCRRNEPSRLSPTDRFVSFSPDAQATTKGGRSFRKSTIAPGEPPVDDDRPPVAERSRGARFGKATRPTRGAETRAYRPEQLPGFLSGLKA